VHGKSPRDNDHSMDRKLLSLKKKTRILGEKADYGYKVRIAYQPAQKESCQKYEG
jgi:hypothetical protein